MSLWRVSSKRGLKIRLRSILKKLYQKINRKAQRVGIDKMEMKDNIFDIKVVFDFMDDK